MIIEIFREQYRAILNQDSETGKFVVMADGNFPWTDLAIKYWCDWAFCQKGMGYRASSVIETGSIKKAEWRWFEISVVGELAVGS